MEKDLVNHPNHYISSTGLECMDVIKAFTENLKGFEAYATGNILKYACRWKKKNEIEDLKKLRKYTDELIDYLENRKEFNCKQISGHVSSQLRTTNKSKQLIIHISEGETAYNIYNSLKEKQKFAEDFFDGYIYYGDIHTCLKNNTSTNCLHSKHDKILDTAQWNKIPPVVKNEKDYTMTFEF